MKRKWMTCGIAGFATGLFQMLGMYLTGRETGMGTGSAAFFVKIGLTGILWMAGAFFACLLAGKAGKRFFSLQKPEPEGIWKNPYFYQLLILAGWLPCYIAYFPAIYSYDGEPQLIQYTTGAFDNHHPILHTLLLGWCYDLGQLLRKVGIACDGMAVYALLQMLLLSGAFAYGIRFLIQKKAGRSVLLCVTAWCSLFPVHALMAVSTTKDTFFTAFFVLTLVLFTELLMEEHFISPLHTLGFFAVLVCLMLFRRNGVYLAAGLCLALAGAFLFGKKSIRRWFYGKLLCLVLAAIVLFSFCDTGLLRATGGIEGEAAEALSVPLQQLARTYKSNGASMTQEELDAVFAYVPKEGLDNYRPYISDGVKQRFDNARFAEDAAGFFRIWGRLMLRYPESYVTAFLYNTMGSWYPCDVSHSRVYADWWRDRTGYFITDAVPVFAGNFVKKENLWPGMRSLYEKIATDCVHQNCLLTMLLFSPALYCLAAVFVCMALFAAKRYRFLIPGTALLVYFLTILAGPCILVRYVYPFMALAPWMAALLFLPLDRKASPAA